MLQIGMTAPNFTLPDKDGNPVTLSDLRGRKVVLYFYPKDNTPGCTRQACAFAGSFSEFERRGVAVVGISKDSVNSHKNFASKYDLPFTLLSDTSTEILQEFGAWGEKKMYGKTTMGTLRKTFIFNEDGILVKIIDKVDTKDHASQILE